MELLFIMGKEHGNDIAEQVWAALSYCFGRSRFKFWNNLSEATDISVGMLSDIRNKKLVGSRKTHEKIAKAFNLPVNDFYEVGRLLVIGVSPDNVFKKNTARPSPQSKKLKSITHRDIINRFKDKHTAKLLNSMLVEIEAADHNRYEDICDCIKTIHSKITKPSSRAKKRDGPDQNKGAKRAIGED